MSGPSPREAADVELAKVIAGHDTREERIVSIYRALATRYAEGVAEGLTRRGEHMPITRDDLENWFTYHAPDADQVTAYAKLRDSARSFALAIIELTPPSADQTAAIRKVREAVMTANAAIACGGK